MLLFLTLLILQHLEAADKPLKYTKTYLTEEALGTDVSSGRGRLDSDCAEDEGIETC